MRRSLAPLVALAVLAIAASTAGARSLATPTTVVLEVFGQGQITSSSPNTGISCGSGATSCYVTFPSGGNITLTETPASGWSFDSWSGACSGSGSCTFALSAGANDVVDASFVSTGAGTSESTLSVTYNTANGNGVVTAPENAPPGSVVYCGVDTATESACSWSNLLTGSTLTLFETPATTSTAFAGWGGGCSGTAQSCTVTLSGSTTVSAAWLASGSTKTLSATVNGNGTITGGGLSCPSACTATEALNASVTLTATPSSGYTFTGWGGACSGSGSCTVTVSADTSVSATFVPAVTLSVTVSGPGGVTGGSGAINCGSGATVCSASFAANASVTLVATPNTGASFGGWTGACGGTATTCTVSMSASRSVTANFTGGATLNVSASGPGTVTGGGITCGSSGSTCSATETANTSVTLVATPNSGSAFTGWSGACSGTSSTCTVSTGTASTIAVSATFAAAAPPPASPSVSVTVSGSGRVTGASIDCGTGSSLCSSQPASGTSVTLTATPASGAAFTGWGGACQGTVRTCTLTVTSADAVIASFSTTKKGGGGGGTITSLAKPAVTARGNEFIVTLRFRTSVAGTARIQGLRAGRIASSVALRVAAGPTTTRFPVTTPGFYRFYLHVGGHQLTWSACLGPCRSAVTSPAFALTREEPTVTTAGAGWSLALHFGASALSDDSLTVTRGKRVLLQLHRLGRAGENALAPMLLGPGTYTIGLRAVDAYGRVRTVSWIVSLGR